MTVHVFRRTPRVRVTSRQDWQVRLVVWAGRAVWGLRTELVLFAVGWTLWQLLQAALPRPAAVLAVIGLQAPLMLWTPANRWLGLKLHAAAVRRAWDRACRHARLQTPADRVPVVVSVRPVPAGDALRVKVPAGSSVLDLEGAAETVAAYLGLREVRVLRDPANARYAAVTLVRVDPLAGTVPLPWPLLNEAQVSLWEPFPVGVDEDGQTVEVALPERNLLLGGEPGAGKSVAQSLPIAVAALDPEVDLYLLDGKQVELSVWRPVARAFVGPDLESANRLLRELQAEMDRRYRWLLAAGRRKVARGDGLRLLVVAVDELAYFLTIGDRNGVREFANLLRDLVSRGRAAGIIVIAATQKPSGDVVPTALRDLFGFRWAFRCSTRDASDTILGAGWATLGYSAAEIAGDQRGVGYLLAEGQTPTRLRSFYLSDDHLAVLAERACQLRAVRPDQDGEDGDGDAALGVVA